MTHPINIAAIKGTSLAHLDSGYALAGDFMVRTHTYFIEPYSLLGPRVDLKHCGMDSRQLNVDLDLAILSLIQRYGGEGLRRSTTRSKFGRGDEFDRKEHRPRTRHALHKSARRMGAALRALPEQPSKSYADCGLPRHSPQKDVI